MTSNEAKGPIHTCPSCLNGFSRPFVCITCGAQTLYDNTVISQQQQIERLREQNEALQAERDTLLAANVVFRSFATTVQRAGFSKDALRPPAAAVLAKVDAIEGRHSEACDTNSHLKAFPLCTCGLDAALKATETP